ncbi:murein transglycosylase D [Erwinia sp. CPCC 100877]|nr:murein transglycosylase D [Erwinia sp. CPCC 100877]
MKAKAILLASVLLVGCQGTKHDGNVQQHAQSLSAAGQGEAGKLTGRATSARRTDEKSFLAQDQDLWAFISNELKMGIPENSRIRVQKQKYLKNKSYLHDVTLRAEPYMYWIAGQIKKRNMPMELVLLPIVESAFDPHATSSRSAAGLWQIIPSTGRNYGLKQTSAYDGRRDVVASTTAALNMMQRLNRMFDGDWLLTVAAYNSGEGRVLNAIKANKRRGKSIDFWSLSLPKETQVYIPKMLALSEIFKNSKQYGVRLPTADEGRALARVEVNTPMTLSKVADMAGISVSQLKTYNAGYKNARLDSSGPQYVMVPRKHAGQLRTSLAASDFESVQSGLLAENRSSAKSDAGDSYTVRKGDTLSTIAARMNVSTRDLQRWNNLRGAQIRPGQKLSLGDAGDDAQLVSNSSNGVTYRVRKGDSLSSIAKRHGVQIKDLERWNDSTDNLRPGDRLTLYVKSDETPET